MRVEHECEHDASCEQDVVVRRSAFGSPDAQDDALPRQDSPSSCNRERVNPSVCIALSSTLPLWIRVLLCAHCPGKSLLRCLLCPGVAYAVCPRRVSLVEDSVTLRWRFPGLPRLYCPLGIGVHRFAVPFCREAKRNAHMHARCFVLVQRKGPTTPRHSRQATRTCVLIFMRTLPELVADALKLRCCCGCCRRSIDVRVLEVEVDATGLPAGAWRQVQPGRGENETASLLKERRSDVMARNSCYVSEYVEVLACF